MHERHIVPPLLDALAFGSRKRLQADPDPALGAKAMKPVIAGVARSISRFDLRAPWQRELGDLLGSACRRLSRIG
ncbi:MAG: hypothetical protein GX576_12910 [Thauera phenolivorans]|uniref:Uncharacterized protein n=1 Tax=Thauera phenolivorans TaxID=1792543 RepID=A0A7X7R8Y4_9RHOO|nr:hypothetical protein [Thauera phenolivorans]